MFTGIVEEIGTIKDLQKKENLIVLTVATRIVWEGTAVGSSIAVDGVCLTVTQMEDGALTFDVMLETIRSTALGRRNRGDAVNLERAVRADGRLDGHIVSGHVDRVEALKERIEGENYLELRFSLDQAIARYVVPKGSITINGVSLTVGRVKLDEFSVYIIPATEKHTNLGILKQHDAVNVEVDLLARYIEKQILNKI